MNISELIQKNKENFKRTFPQIYDDRGFMLQERIIQWNDAVIKDLIDAVIEDEWKNMKEILAYDSDERGWNASKQDTISKLKAIKELL